MSDHPQNTECLETFAQIKSLLFGNGHPEHGLLMRVRDIEKMQRWLLYISILNLVLALSGDLTTVLRSFLGFIK